MKLIGFLLLLPRNLLIAPVLVWRKFISPLYGDVCRYYPSCSTYGLQSIQRKGVIRGIPLTIWRILRCNPWSAGGVDEVSAPPVWISIGQLGFVSPDFDKRQR